MKKLFKKKWVKIVAIILGVGVVALISTSIILKNKKGKKVEEFTYVRTITLSYDSLNETVVASGTIESQTTSTITSSINNATISKINYSVGDEVKEGDVIIELDTTNLNKQISKQSEKVTDQEEMLQETYDTALETYEDAEDAYENSKTAVNNASNALTTANNAIKDYKDVYNEKNDAYNDSVTDCLIYAGKACELLADDNNYKIAWQTAKTELDDAKKTLDVAKEANNYDALEKAYNTALENKSKAKSTKQQAENALDKAADALNDGVDSDSLDELYDTVTDYKLKAKSSGQITSINAVLGASTNGTLATIQDTNKLKINVTVDEYDILKLELGMRATIETDASDKIYDGKVSQISPVATGSFGSTGFDVEIEVTSTDIDDLLIGMSAEVTIIISSTDETFSVPVDAIEEKEDGTKVIYVQNEQGEFDELEVTTGDTNGYYIEIFSDELEVGLKVRASANAEEAEVKVTNEDMTDFPGGGFDFGGSGGFPQGGGSMPSGGPSGGGSFTPPSGGGSRGGNGGMPGGF